MALRTAITQRRNVGRGQTFSVSNNGSAASYVDLLTNFNPSTTNWTVSLFFKADNLPPEVSPAADHNIYSQQDGAGTGRSWIFINRTNNKFSNFFNGTFQDSSVTVVSGGWYHIVLSYTLSSTTLNWTINGVAQGTFVVAPESATGAHRLGANKTGSGPMWGKITELRVWTTNLSVTDAGNLYFDKNFSRTLLNTEILFTEGTGTSAADTSGNGNNGTLVGTAKWTTEYAF